MSKSIQEIIHDANGVDYMNPSEVMECIIGLAEYVRTLPTAAALVAEQGAETAGEAPQLPAGYTMPVGYEWTGEMRLPKSGEQYINPGGIAARITDVDWHDPAPVRPIIRPIAKSAPAPAPAPAPLPDEVQKLRNENESLAKFKAYVHRRLDEAGIEKDPESPHKTSGCRIGGRLDIVLNGWTMPRQVRDLWTALEWWRDSFHRDTQTFRPQTNLFKNMEAARPYFAFPAPKIVTVDAESGVGRIAAEASKKPFSDVAAHWAFGNIESGASDPHLIDAAATIALELDRRRHAGVDAKGAGK